MVTAEAITWAEAAEVITTAGRADAVTITAGRADGIAAGGKSLYHGDAGGRHDEAASFVSTFTLPAIAYRSPAGVCSVAGLTFA